MHTTKTTVDPFTMHGVTENAFSPDLGPAPKTAAARAIDMHDAIVDHDPFYVEWHGVHDKRSGALGVFSFYTQMSEEGIDALPR